MPKVLLGDVAHEHKETCKGSKDGYPIVGLEHLIPEEITLTTWDEGRENTFTKMFRKGNVLFGRRRAYLKKAAVAPFDGICSGDITVIEADPDKILPELLPFVVGVEAGGLHHGPGAGAGPGQGLLPRLAEQGELPLGGGRLGRHHPDDGGLARPVAAHQAVNLPLGYGQVGVIHRQVVPVPLGQPLGR